MLSPQTAAAWGVDVSTPIHLKVSFNDSAYTDTHKATTAMEIFQLVDGKKGVRAKSHSGAFNLGAESTFISSFTEIWFEGSVGEHCPKLPS
jgi:hypothetical protein